MHETPSAQPRPDLDECLWPAAFNVAPKWAVERGDVFEREMEHVFEGPV